MASARIVDQPVGAVSTTDATVTTLLAYTLATGQTVTVEFLVNGRTSTPAGAGWILSGVFKNVGGTVSQIGATAGLLAVQDAALVTTTAVFDVTGATFRIRVTGVAATNIDWLTSGKVVVN